MATSSADFVNWRQMFPGKYTDPQSMDWWAAMRRYMGGEAVNAMPRVFDPRMLWGTAQPNMDFRAAVSQQMTPARMPVSFDRIPQGKSVSNLGSVMQALSSGDPLAGVNQSQLQAIATAIQSQPTLMSLLSK